MLGVRYFIILNHTHVTFTQATAGIVSKEYTLHRLKEKVKQVNEIQHEVKDIHLVAHSQF